MQHDWHDWLVHKTNKEVISGHAPFLRKKINFVNDEENKKFPNICQTRFIKAAPQFFV